jgi:hypothetical protein
MQNDFPFYLVNVERSENDNVFFGWDERALLITALISIEILKTLDQKKITNF